MKVLAVLALGLAVSGGTATAHATATRAAEGGDGSHACCCGPRCSGVSCCCGPKKAKPGKPHRDPAPSRPAAATGSGPCLGAAPCGDPAVPTATTAGPTARAATLARKPALHAPSKGGRLPASPPSPRLPARLASRLERPPRGLAPA